MKEKQPSDSLGRIRDSLKILKLNEINRVLDDELARAAQESSPPIPLVSGIHLGSECSDSEKDRAAYQGIKAAGQKAALRF